MFLSKVCSVSRARLFWLLSGVYLVLIVECFSLGFLSHATLAEVLDHSEIEVQRRSTPVVIILTLLASILLGYIGTIPFLCYAVQKRSPHALVPYLIWRAFLCILVIGFVVWQLIHNESSQLFKSSLFGRPLTFILCETIMGGLFFCAVFIAYREFNSLEEQKERSPERDAFS